MSARAQLLLVLWLAAACASTPEPPPPRPFDFTRDTFAYSNDLYWDYGPNGETPRPRDAPVGFGNRCAPMARATRQFYRAARFDPAAPHLDDAGYRALVRRVLDASDRYERPVKPVTIPGYADLRSFSADHEELLKAETGGRTRSFTQRGNWRLLFPFSPGSQRDLAYRALAELAAGRLPIVHLANFPTISLNHTVVVFAAEETPTEIRFRVYDPNHKLAPRALVYHRATTTFVFDRTEFFPGGAVKAWEVYRGLLF